MLYDIGGRACHGLEHGGLRIGFDSKMKSKKVWTIGILAGLVGAIVVAFLLRHPATQDLELLELLPPDLDIYVVADLQSLGTNPIIQKLLSNPPGFARDEEYERFIQATGFRYEQDLKHLVLAKSGPDWVGAARATVDRPRIIRYMESQGGEKKDERGKTVFTFGRSRRFRLVFLDDGSADTLVAFTVGGDDTRIRQAVERRLGRLKESAAAEIKRARHLTHIPPGSKIWLVGRPERLWGPEGATPQVGPLGLSRNFFKGSQTLYVSIESGPAQLSVRVEDYCDTPASAQRIAGSVQGILALLKALPLGNVMGPGKAAPRDQSKAANTNTKSLLAGVSVEQDQQSVFLRWQLDNNALSFLEAASR